MHSREYYKLYYRIETIDMSKTNEELGQELISAVKENNIDKIINLLLNSRVDINTQDRFGNTPLITATKYKLKKVVIALLIARANTDKKDILGKTALHWSIINNDEEITSILLNAKANINTQDIFYNTPLMQASLGRAGIVKLLLESDYIDLDIPNIFKITPLMSAAGHGYTKIVQMLLKSNADITIRSYQGLTALDIAYNIVKNIKITDNNKTKYEKTIQLLEELTYPDVHIGDDCLNTFLNNKLPSPNTQVTQVKSTDVKKSPNTNNINIDLSDEDEQIALSGDEDIFKEFY